MAQEDETLKRSMRMISTVQEEMLEFLRNLTKKYDVKYQQEAEAFIQENAQDGLATYHVDDKIRKEVEKELKAQGVPFMALDNCLSDTATYILPSKYAQFAESIAIKMAERYDRISEITEGEINDLCFYDGFHNTIDGTGSPDRYQLNVPNELIANRLRETLTKDNDKRAAFAMNRNEDGSCTFYVAAHSTETLNRAYFEACWSFAGKYAELNEKQEAYDYEKQKELESRILQGGHYFIVDPEIDENGNATGNIREMTEVTESRIILYKDGVTESVSEPIMLDQDGKSLSDTSLATIKNWSDRQMRPIIIETDEMDRVSELLKERNPKVFLEEKDLNDYKEDKKSMLQIETKIERAFEKPLSDKSEQAIIEQCSKYNRKVGEQMREYMDKADAQTVEIDSTMLSSLDRTIELLQLREKELSKDHEITKETTIERTTETERTTSA